MPVNRLALIRYKTIDNCLRNRFRKWTIHDLVEACSGALYEFEGKSEGVSLRTVQLDIQNMRSEKLGYNAPIVVVDKKYYIYEDADYSITNMPLSSTDIEYLSDLTQALKQFEGFSQFSEISEVLKKIENKVFAIHNKNKVIIDFEKNNNLKGIQFLNILYDAIKNKKAITLEYQSFKAKRSHSIFISPYLLKEYRNRWFVFGKEPKRKIVSTLALDRIIKIKNNDKYEFEENQIFEAEDYFKDIIGVTKLENKQAENIVFWVHNKHVPYVETKPFHVSQQCIEKTEDGAIFQIQVIHNYELEKEFLGFGEFLKVIKPIKLKETLKNRIAQMQMQYED